MSRKRKLSLALDRAGIAWMDKRSQRAYWTMVYRINQKKRGE